MGNKVKRQEKLFVEAYDLTTLRAQVEFYERERKELEKQLPGGK